MSLRLLALKHANAYADKHTHEEGGSNRGPDVDHFQRVLGLDPADENPWCACFVTTCLCEAAFDLHPAMNGDFPQALAWLKANFINCSALVADMAVDAQNRGIWKGADWNPKPGSLVCYTFPTGHHIGFVRGLQGAILATTEGNTGDGHARDGDGVYYRTRPLTFVWGYIDLGDS